MLSAAKSMLFLLASTSSKPTSGNSAGSFIVLAIIVVAFFLIWRNFAKPRQRAAQAQRNTLMTLEPGDEVLTGAGIFGTIQHIQGDRVTLWTGTGSTITVLKRTIAQKITDDDLEPTEHHDDDAEDHPENLAVGAGEDETHEADSAAGLQTPPAPDEHSEDVHEDSEAAPWIFGSNPNGQVGGPVGDRTSPENKAEEDDR